MSNWSGALVHLNPTPGVGGISNFPSKAAQHRACIPRRYVIIAPATSGSLLFPRARVFGVCLKIGVPQSKMVMLKRISEATSQSNSKRVFPASDIPARTNPTVTSVLEHFRMPLVNSFGVSRVLAQVTLRRESKERRSSH